MAGKRLYNTGMRRLFLLVWVVVSILLAVSGQPTAAQNGDALYFPETNLWVRGEFLRFYRQAPDPFLLFGYPISAEMQDATGNTVQYFERARFDLKQTKQGSQVSLANLGWMLFESAPGAQELPASSSTCRLFTATGKSVCYDFLKFYDKYNGALYFGDPITNMEERGGVYVQYFSNARLEFNPNRTGAEPVRIADLGRLAYSHYVGSVPPTINRSGSTSGAAAGGITARAFVARSVLPAGARQTVVVAVQDGSHAPVSTADVNIVLQYRDGRVEKIGSGKVNAEGIYTVSSGVRPSRVNEVVKVWVEVNVNGVLYPASSWFRIWY